MKNIIYFFVFNVLLLLCVKYSASLKYVPPNREVEVVQHAAYTIGIDDAIDLDVAKCNFTSNTGLNCTFEVSITRSFQPRASPYCAYNGQLFLFENTVTEHGKDGLCQITVGMVQDTGPSVWTLTVYDFYNKTVLSNTFTVHFFYKAPLLEYEIKVQEYTNFLNHITELIDLKSCNVKFNSTVIELDLHSSKTNTFISPFSPETEEVTKRVSSLGRGLCGFIFKNATNMIRHLEWTLTATGEHDKPYRGIFKTRIDARTSEENMHSTRRVYIGSSHVIACGASPTATDTCSIFNPVGELVETNKCRYTINSVKMHDLGVWKCYAGSKNAMEALQFTIELIGKDPETVTSWQHETDGYLGIGCQMVRLKGTVKYCKMIAPDQRRFVLRSFAATERYLSIGTRVREGICSMQIKKPLQESEKGLWQCEIGLQYRDVTGSTIAVGTPPTADYPKYIKVTTQLNDPFRIYCVVPYFTEYCRIRAPNGTQFQSTNENDIRLGRCWIDVQHTTLSDNGTWICSYAQEMGTPDDEIVVEVTVGEVLSYYKYVEVDSGDSTELMCSSGGLPLKYCRYISPAGKGYHIGNHENSSTISYYGRGLEYGDCGIKIENTKTTDNGYWRCVTQLISDAKHEGEISARILLDVTPSLLEGPNLAAIGIGTAVAIVLIGSVAGIVGMRKWRRREHDEVPGISTADRGVNTDDNMSQNSETNVFSMEPVPRSDTTTQDEEHEHQL